MSRSDQVYLQDILESIRMIFSYVDKRTESDFMIDFMLQDAVIRRFEIIGEAATKISTDFKVRHSEVQWSLMKSMRNKLVHEYFGISPATVYLTIQIDLPVLKEQLEKMT